MPPCPHAPSVSASHPFLRWDAGLAAALNEPQLPLYRSNLLGSDLRITNYGGGDTSAKILHRDPLSGQMVEVLWVKGLGGDISSMQQDGFATQYMDKVAGRLQQLAAHQHVATLGCEPNRPVLQCSTLASVAAE